MRMEQQKCSHLRMNWEKVCIEIMEGIKSKEKPTYLHLEIFTENSQNKRVQ